MTTALFTHQDCLRHNPGSGHPESPARLASILSQLQGPEYAGLVWREAPLAEIEQIARVHERGYVEDVLNAVPKQGYAALDHDTIISPASGEAALRAAGALVAAVDAVMAGTGAVAVVSGASAPITEQSRHVITNAFCAVRPPGHHAERDRAMGFCLFNNVAIGAAHALAVHGLQRVAIVDFDVHHGNGTQDWAEGQAGVLFASTHQYPFYPGTGAAHEKGPQGNIVNMPLPHGAGSAEFRHAMESIILPAVARFAPEMIFISAGFDAHASDPLAGFQLNEGDFGWITGELCRAAKQSAKGRIVSTLEGGYDLGALAASAGAHVKALMAA